MVSHSQTTIYSASGGAWADGATWIGGVMPAPGDNAVIRKGHTVSLATGSGEIIDFPLNSLIRHCNGSHEIIIAMKMGDSARRYKWLHRF
jgi:hypothetical protein